MDTLNPARCWGSEMIRLMARKTYSDEFRRQAVDLYESTPGATFKGIAADLGISRGALAEWVRVLGTGTTTPVSTVSGAGSPGAAPGASSGSAAAARPARGPASGPVPGLGRGESPAARIARLEARVAELEAETTKLSTEREILRSAAKYFAGETNW
jgi:transposase